MTKAKPARETIAVPSQAPRQRQLVQYESAKLKPSFATQLGNTAGGTLYGNTAGRPSHYTIGWMVGSPMIFIRWKSSTDGVVEYDVPLVEFESFRRLTADDQHVELE